MRSRKVVIVGAGPAGISAALTLSQAPDCEVTLVDRGLDLSERVAVREGRRPAGDAAVNLEGFGGAGAFSDGKLTLTAEVGGHLADLVGRAAAQELIARADRLWLEFGAPTQVWGADDAAVADLQRRATVCGLKLVPTPLRHLGTDRAPSVLAAMRDRLARHCRILTATAVTTILVDDGGVTGVRLETGEELPAEYVVVAPGRSGQPWFQQEARRMGLDSDASPVDLGVRVETPAAVLEPLTERLYEFKLLYWSPVFDNLVRTFCVCPRGEVVTERLGDVVTVNGHSYAIRQTDNTNFALLVSSRFTKPFDDPIAYGQYIARLANLLGDGVLVQRLVDLQAGRRSTPHRMEHCITTPTLASAAPGDLSYVLPYRHLRVILEMLAAMDRLVPGVNGPATLLYGVEVKLYSARVMVTAQMETQVRNLFACGDGAGVTRGLMQASASGLAAGQAIAERLAAG